MQRVVGLFALSGCACLVSGCGGSSLEAKARKVVADPHATVVSTQTVKPLSGAPLSIVVMKPGGSQGLGCLNDLMGDQLLRLRGRELRTLGSGSSPSSTS